MCEQWQFGHYIYRNIFLMFAIYSLGLDETFQQQVLLCLCFCKMNDCSYFQLYLELMLIIALSNQNCLKWGLRLHWPGTCIAIVYETQTRITRISQEKAWFQYRDKLNFHSVTVVCQLLPLCYISGILVKSNGTARTCASLPALRVLNVLTVLASCVTWHKYSGSIWMNWKYQLHEQKGKQTLSLFFGWFQWF